MKKIKKAKNAIKVAIISQSSDLTQDVAGGILQSYLKAHKRILDVSQHDIWSLFKIIIPKNDPNWLAKSKNDFSRAVDWIYQYQQNISLKNRPTIDKDKVDIALARKFLRQEKPKIIFTLNPLARDVMLLARRREQLPVGIVAVCPRYYTGHLWAGDEGDLWTVPLLENREQLLAEFVYDKRIIVSGQLINRKDICKLEKTAARKKLSWPLKGLTVGIVADGILNGLVEELIERISAFPDMQLVVIIFSQDEDFRSDLQQKAHSFLAKIIISSLPAEPSIVFRALDLILFSHNQIYLPLVIANNLPSLILTEKDQENDSAGEVDLLASQGLILKAQVLKDFIWKTEMILKNRQLLKDLHLRLVKKPAIRPAPEIIMEEIFKRMKK